MPRWGLFGVLIRVDCTSCSFVSQGQGVNVPFSTLENVYTLLPLSRSTLPGSGARFAWTPCAKVRRTTTPSLFLRVIHGSLMCVEYAWIHESLFSNPTGVLWFALCCVARLWVKDLGGSHRFARLESWGSDVFAALRSTDQCISLFRSALRCVALSGVWGSLVRGLDFESSQAEVFCSGKGVGDV